MVAVAALTLSPLAGAVSAYAGDDHPQFAEIIEANRPAVVNIQTTITAPAAVHRFPGERGPGGQTPFDEFFRRFFEQMPEGPPGPGQEAMAQGSGFLISADGYIVTNNHVVENATEISVTSDAGETYPARLLGADPKTDLALLKIDAERPLAFVEFGDSDAARVGDWVIAIGNPFGLGGTATAGIISARSRDLQAGPYDDFIQIDAPINRGNSGGPVFNADGQVIGVNTMIYSPNGGNVGIGFAIPATQVTEIVADLRANGTVQRGWLGVQIQTVTDEIADGMGLTESRGALIARVEPGSPADKAGLKSGDVIVDFGGERVDTAKALSRLVARTDRDVSVDVGLWRDGKRRERDVRIGAQAQEAVQVADAAAAEGGRLGLELSRLTPDTRLRFRIPEDVDGALVVGIDPTGAAAKQGLRPGDVISMVGQQPVSTPDDVRKQVDTAVRDDRDHVVVRVERNGGSRFVAMKLA
jgi:serine protease Do